MIHYLVDGVGLGTSCLALYFVLRVRKTFFLDSRFFIGTANLGFIGILLQQLVSDLTEAPPSEAFYVTMIAETTFSVGFASYLLSRNRGGSGLKELAELLSKPPRSFLAYCLIVTAWVGAARLLQPWQLTSIPTVEAVVYYYYTPEAWYVVSSSILLAAFIVFPVLNLYRQGMHLADSKADHSIRVISLSWAAFGTIAFVQAAIGGSLSFLAQTVGTTLDSFLFIMIALALREPTILSRIISAGEYGHQPVYQSLGPDTIVLYNVASDRRKRVEAFSKEALASGHDAVCFAGKAEVPFYTTIIKEAGPRLIRGAGHVSIQQIDANLDIDASLAPRLLKGQKRTYRLWKFRHWSMWEGPTLNWGT